MKTFKLKQSIILLSMLFLAITVNGGERIDGNGILSSKKIKLDQFYKIEVGTYCNVIVNAGAMPMYELEVDENLQDYYKVYVNEGILKIEAIEWPEPTKIKLTIQVPFISEFTNSGWGNVKINNLTTNNFTLNSKTGKVDLNGKVETLKINAGTGTIDARNLNAITINHNQSSHGSSYLSECDYLNISGKLGKVIYKGSPVVNKEAAANSLLVKNAENKNIRMVKKNELQNVTITIKNNSFKWHKFVIRGPKMHDFSYGFSMLPFATKKERIPVGTKFYKESITGNEKELVSISANDSGTTINLFE